MDVECDAAAKKFTKDRRAEQKRDIARKSREAAEKAKAEAKLRELERAAALAPTAQAVTPLFGPRVGAEFTHAEVEAAFHHMLHCGGGVPEAELDDF